MGINDKLEVNAFVALELLLALLFGRHLEQFSFFCFAGRLRGSSFLLLYVRMYAGSGLMFINQRMMPLSRGHVPAPA